MARDGEGPLSYKEIRTNIEVSSEFDVAYVTMNVLATIVACYGLFENSPAVVIGAMIIAMLLGPISGVGLALVDRDNRLLGKAARTLIGGMIVVYATAFLLAIAQPDFPLTNEIYARTSPTLMDLMIALGGGAAGAYAMTSPRLSSAFVGVAIATALVPPLCSSAICLARGEKDLASGAFLLAFANIVAIQVACSAVMWMSGFRGAEHLEGGSELQRNLISLVVLGVLAVLLATKLNDLLAEELHSAAVRKALVAASETHPGAALVDMRVQNNNGHAVVIAVYRTPVPFTPAEVAAIEPKLPLPGGSSSQELRIRSVPVTVASKNGYLYSVGDISGDGLKDP